MSNKLKLYCDLDCTITATIAAIISLYNEDFKYYSDFVEINPEEVNTWGFDECNCATKEYIDTYFNQQRMFDRLEFIDECTYSVLFGLKDYFDITVVSHGYSPNLRAKEIWLKKNLPWVDFIGVNLKEYPDKSCVDMSNGIFIDDGANNLLNSNAIKKYCFGKVYPWNKDWTGARFTHWRDLREQLMKDLEELL